VTGVLVVDGEVRIVAEQAAGTVLVRREEVQAIVAVAEQGPPGPPGAQGPAGSPGPAGGAIYTHTQSTPAAVWTVAHNLGRRPSIAVTDHLGNVLIADTQYLDANLAQITHSVPAIGYAYCN
jgi:hypothetical protein